MGGGSWSKDSYDSSVKGKAAFKFSDDTLKKPREEQKAAEELNPYGLIVRESRDNEEHPESNAIAVGLDITGSMSAVVVRIQSELGKLMTMLLDNGIVPDPQLLCYAVGDAGNGDNEPAPFQISQFESDIRINEQLKKIFLVGRGGGNLAESYELGLYAMARHTALDCLEKRGVKGCLITIGDECAYDKVKAKEIKAIFDAKIGQDIPTKTIVSEVLDKFNMIHIIPKGSSHFKNPTVRKYWNDLVGAERVVYPSPEAVCETIAVFVGLCNGKFDLAGGVALVEQISGAKIAKEVNEALTNVAQFIGYVAPKASTTPVVDSGAQQKADTKTDPATGKPKKNKPGRLF